MAHVCGQKEKALAVFHIGCLDIGDSGAYRVAGGTSIGGEPAGGKRGGAARGHTAQRPAVLCGGGGLSLQSGLSGRKLWSSDQYRRLSCGL